MIAPAESSPAESTTTTILIVDDDRSVADTFARMLKLEGFEVATALSAEAGLELADSVQPARHHPRHAHADHQRPAVSPAGPGQAASRSTSRSPSSPATTSCRSPIQHELKSLGASIRFKPLWLEDLIALAQTLVVRRERPLPPRLPAAAGRRARRSGSCARPAATWRTTARCASATPCSRSAAQPELAVAVTLQPVDAIDVDAAILFSDLLLPFTPMGLDFDFVKGEGPSIERPIRTPPTSTACASSSRARRSAHVLETIRLLRRSWRIACRSSASAARRSRSRRTRSKAGRRRTTRRTKAFMYAQPEAWHRLCDRFATRDGRLPAARRSRPASQAIADLRFVGRRARRAPTTASSRCRTRARIFDALAGAGCRLIHFGVGTTAILPDMAEAGGDVIGVDWRLPLDEAWTLVGHDRAIQGNLDPTLLLGPADRLFAAADDVLRRAGRPARPHLQSRARRPAGDAARARAGARAPRARRSAGSDSSSAALDVKLDFELYAL